MGFSLGSTKGNQTHRFDGILTTFLREESYVQLSNESIIWNGLTVSSRQFRPFLGSDGETSSVTLQNGVSFMSPSPTGVWEKDGLSRSLTGSKGGHR